MLHLTCRDFFAFQRKQLRYAEEWATQRHRAGKRCGYLSILTHTLGAFVKTGCCAPAGWQTGVAVSGGQRAIYLQ